jgi:hypothetical protein
MTGIKIHPQSKIIGESTSIATASRENQDWDHTIGENEKEINGKSRLPHSKKGLCGI